MANTLGIFVSEFYFIALLIGNGQQDHVLEIGSVSIDNLSIGHG